MGMKGMFVAMATVFLTTWLREPQVIPTETAFVRLEPNASLGLPPTIAQYLVDRGYTIPFVVATTRTRNVVRGEFVRRGQHDLAVLVSRKGSSAILIFWRETTQAPTTLARRPDHSIRAIHKADPKYIREHYEGYGGVRPPSPLTHDGIDDGLVEKGSIVWYLHRGKWLQLTGAD